MIGYISARAHSSASDVSESDAARMACTVSIGISYEGRISQSSSELETESSGGSGSKILEVGNNNSSTGGDEGRTIAHGDGAFRSNIEAGTLHEGFR